MRPTREEAHSEAYDVCAGQSSNSFPWWEKLWAATSEATEASFHVRTRLQGHRVGPLVDPGAHDTLIGEQTAGRLEEQTASVGDVKRREFSRLFGSGGLATDLRQPLRPDTSKFR
jgi:predicted aspartyl protease